MSRSTALRIESLESRDLMSVFGNPWPNADRLTMSFAPNGVSYSNQTWGSSTFSSNLFSELNGTMTTAVWQEELLRAFDAWAAQANLNVGLVADSGRSFGPDGFSVTGPAAADIRVGAFDQSPEVLATSVPFHPLTGYHAGNLMLNGVKTYTKGGATGTFDLFTVALHESANLLGMADYDADTASARNGSYRGPRTGLKQSDIDAVRAMYGTRPNDSFEGTGGNATTATATALTPATDPAATTRKRVVADGIITTAADADVYKFTTPSGTTSLTVRLGTAGKSLLAGKVEVLDSTGKVLKTTTNTSPLQGDTLVSTAASAGKVYYVRVAAARTDAFSVGSYQLRAGFNYDPVKETKADPVQRLGSDAGANDTRATATTLTPTPGYTANTRYSAAARVESVTDNDFYKLTSPASGPVMTVSVQALEGLSASATVLSSTGAVVLSNIILNWENGLYRAQAPVLAANATYFLQVKVQDPNWSEWTGDYLMDVDFRQPLAMRDTVAVGTANATTAPAYGFEVRESRAFTFALHAVSTDTAACDWFDITVYDANGQVVAALGTDGRGSVDTLTVFLNEGKYTICCEPRFNTTSTATVAFRLSAALISDPIDVYDPTVPPPPSDPPFTVDPTPTDDEGYYDPWSDPVG